MRPAYPIALLCRVFDVSRSGFYAWLNRKPSSRRQADERLKVAIRAAHRQSREAYGVRRMQPELEAQGFAAGRDRIGRLRQELGLRCKQKRKFKATTYSRDDLPVAPICWNSGSTRQHRASNGWSTLRMCRPEKAGFTLLACRTSLHLKSSATPWTSA